ncbi:nuclease-related domain-containing protein [Bacillus xiapuensis]|uniref:Nuclease-related domain-containing protein n=1 Tax=Bacillus xiapuensis TaxID=2014075 RepID=A0ABU6N4A3_9BACI|nr:nuclease-related domain-containing protein [Bacillus xiapuensis]
MNCLKERDPSLTLAGVISAQKRLSVSHLIFPVLSSKQASVEAGIGGEEKVAEIFRRYSFPFNHHIFHDLSPSSDEKFQMDTYFMTPSYGLVLETKNIGGSLEFRENPPLLIRTKENGQKDGFESPVVQMERDRELLSAWLRSRNIHIPVYGAVVLAYPKQIVEVPPRKAKILFPSSIPAFINSLPQQEKKLDPVVFDWLSSELLKSHQRFIPKPICETYQIKFTDIRPGVICKVCDRIRMMKHRRVWYCPHCHATDPIAHVRTIQEWFLLFKREITNRECREFLGIEDIDTAKRILLNMNMTWKGAFRYRTYIMDLSKI